MRLNGDVTKCPEACEARADIVSGLWQNRIPITPPGVDTWSSYFTYYAEECKVLRRAGGKYAAIKTHWDIIRIARKLDICCSKSEIYDKIHEILEKRDEERRGDGLQPWRKEEKDQIVEGSIRLVVRLFAMVDIGPISKSEIVGPTPLEWSNAALSLDQLLANHFKRSSSRPDTTKFGRLFNVLNIKRFTGIRIQWTDSLANHLRLVDDDTTLCVFHHVTFLEHAGNHRTIFPEGFLDETIRTLELLFPWDDEPTRQWLEREGHRVIETTRLDTKLLKLNRLRARDRRLDKFDFWYDELMELKEKFEKPGFTSLTQMWYDRRNRGQWITFWLGLVIAVATLLALGLSVVQTGLGAVQVYKAYRPSEG